MRTVRRFLSFLVLCCVLVLPGSAGAQIAVGISVNIAPPPLPIYAEPPIPADGYIFIPGYWGWVPSGYYWVPGTWVLPPSPGLLWTPGYWAFANSAYVWSPGYWGPHVGFYGGINYGFGYFGTGYEGGYWHDNHFFYNRVIHNFGGVHVANVYGKAVPTNRGARVSFAGGTGGTAAHPGPDEDAASREPHVPPSDVQTRHETQAGTLHHAQATVNHGRPPVAATPKPATFTGRGIVGARPVPAVHPAATRPAPAKPAPAAHAPEEQHR